MGLVINAWFFEVRDGEGDAFWPLLSLDEQARAARFVRHSDRETWVVSRGRTRQVLGTYLGADPAAIVFGVGGNGRPYIAGSGSGVPSFNVSHTEKYIALAVSHEAEVGVDIEAVRPISDDEIAWALSPAEQEQLLLVPPTARLEAFFRFWTLKEAFMKGMGLGASLPLHDFDIGLDDPRLLRIAGLPNEPGRWRFVEAMPALDIRAAVAARTEGPTFTVNWRS